MDADRNQSVQRLFALGQGGGQVQAEVGIEHAHAFLGQDLFDEFLHFAAALTDLSTFVKEYVNG